MATRVRKGKQEGQPIKSRMTQSNEVTSKTVKQVTQQTSLETVKTMVYHGVGCVAYLRSLFSQDHFEEGRILAVPKETQPGDEPNPIRNTTSLKVQQLKRGVSKQADTFLNIIDGGVNDALDRGYLKELTLAIRTSLKDPAKVFEAWSFNFTYSITPDGTKVTNLELRDRDNKVLAKPGTKPGRVPSQASIERQAAKLLRVVLTEAQELSDLPTNRCFDFRIVYTNDTPADYNPPGFHAAGPSAQLPATARRTNFDEFRSPFHSVSIGVASLAHPSSDQAEDTSDDDEPGQAAQGDDALGSATDPVRPSSLQPAQTGTSPHQLGTDGGEGQGGEEDEEWSDTLTEEGDEAGELLRLRGGSGDAEEIADAEERAPALTESDGEEQANASSAPKRKITKSNKKPKEQRVIARGCECHGISHGLNLSCSKCKMQRHQWCYGFDWEGHRTFKLSHEFVCWTCQARLGAVAFKTPQVKEALQSLAILALKRRCFADAYTKVKTARGIAGAIGTKHAITAELLHELEDEGFVIPAHNGKNARYDYENDRLEQRRQQAYFTPGGGLELEHLQAFKSLAANATCNSAPASTAVMRSVASDSHLLDDPDAAVGEWDKLDANQQSAKSTPTSAPHQRSPSPATGHLAKKVKLDALDDGGPEEVEPKTQREIEQEAAAEASSKGKSRAKGAQREHVKASNLKTNGASQANSQKKSKSAAPEVLQQRAGDGPNNKPFVPVFTNPKKRGAGKAAPASSQPTAVGGSGRFKAPMLPQHATAETMSVDAVDGRNEDAEGEKDSTLLGDVEEDLRERERADGAVEVAKTGDKAEAAGSDGFEFDED